MIYLLILAWVIPGTILWAMINLNQKSLPVWMLFALPLFILFGPLLVMGLLAESRMFQRFFTYEIWRGK